MPQRLSRLLSYIWPVRVWRGSGAHGYLEVVWEYGRAVVNSAHANQSFGSLHRVWQRAFKDADIRERKPATALVLGYGAGSVARIIAEELALPTRLVGVDDDPMMLDLARKRPLFRPAQDVELIEADAFAYVARCEERFDLIVVDLFHDLDFAPGVEERSFLTGIRRLASPWGVVLVNTVAHDEKSAHRSARLGDELRLVFAEVRERHYEGINRVYIAL